MFLVFLIFFIKNERFELVQIKQVILKARLKYIFLALFFSVVYIILQGWLYVRSFNTIGEKISLKDAVNLFLKRNLIGVFVPGGTFSSLAFFNNDLKKHIAKKTPRYLGSYLFGFASTISIIIIAIPAIIILFLKNELTFPLVIGFIVMAIIIFLMGWGLYSLLNTKKNWSYQLILKYKPDWIVMMDEISDQTISQWKLIQTILISVGIEITGVIHLYLAILALHATPSLDVALTGYVAMVIIMSFSPFLKGLGAIEFSLTYLLVQFGFPTMLAASITLLFRFFEFWLPLFSGIILFIFKKEGLLVRLVPSFIILILGIVNIVSAITPAIPARMALLQDMLPVSVTQLSNFTILIFGIVLIILSIYLFLGVRNAWKMGLFLTFISMVGHLTKAIDYEESLVAFIAFFSLILSRKFYYLKHDIIIQKKKFLRISLIMLAVFIYAVAGFYFMDKIHFNKDLNFSQSVEFFGKILFIHNDQSFLPNTTFAREFLFSVRFIASSMFVYIIWILLQPAGQSREIFNAEHETAKEIIKLHGKSRLDYFKAYFDKLLFFNQEKTGFISYKIAHNYAMALEDPVISNPGDNKDLIKSFKKFCNLEGLGIYYYRIPETSLKIYKNMGYRSVLIGQEAVLELDSFTLAGGSKSALRNTINKIHKLNLLAKVHEAPQKDGLLQKLKQVSNEWMESHKMHEIGFTQGIFNEKALKDTSIITVENEDEKVIAFMNLIPDYSNIEGTYDLLRKTSDAPNGIIDFLMINMFEYFKSKGYRSVNLGMVPLTGFEKGHSLQQRAIYYITESIKNNSRFKGLFEFKDKYEPNWTNKYLIYENTYDLLRFPLVINKVSKI